MEHPLYPPAPSLSKQTRNALLWWCRLLSNLVFIHSCLLILPPVIWIFWVTGRQRKLNMCLYWNFSYCLVFPESVVCKWAWNTTQGEHKETFTAHPFVSFRFLERQCCTTEGNNKPRNPPKQVKPKPTEATSRLGSCSPRVCSAGSPWSWVRAPRHINHTAATCLLCTSREHSQIPPRTAIQTRHL